MKKSSVYEDVGDGWQDVPKRLELACCDCSLVHSIVFRAKLIGSVPLLQWKVDRNERATAALRRHRRPKRASR
jgi:hypothetical protein